MADAEPADGALESARVVLMPGAARVFLRGMWHNDVPIQPVRAGEDIHAVVARLTSDAVVLAAGTDAAIVRVGSDIIQDVPLFKLRKMQGTSGVGSMEEVRVRVDAIRPRKAEPVSAGGPAPATAAGGTEGTTEGVRDSAAPKKGLRGLLSRRKKENGKD
ncbi:MAG: hypothetical protein ACYDDF_02085 [Thermoplasmatota archaeon]